MKQRINWIKPKDLEDIMKSAKRDKDNNYLVPDTLEIYVVPTKEERIQVEIARLEKELAGMKEPTREELIEEGMLNSAYYMALRELEYYRSKGLTEVKR